MKKILGIFITISVMIMAACSSSASTASELTALPTATPIPIGGDEDLAAIITAAGDGETLTLGEGTYQLAEGLVIQKSLTIIGAGKDKTIITTSKPVTYGEENYAILHFDSEGSLTLKGLTLAYSGTDPSNVLRIYNGNLELSDCYLRGATLDSEGKAMYSLSLINSSIGHVEDCIFGGNTGLSGEYIPGGIGLAGEAQLEISDSQIPDASIGIIAQESSTATITSSFFSNNGYSAILFLNNSSGSASQNEINSNGGYWGIACSGTASVVLEANKIDNTQVGIDFQGSCSGRAAQNEITNNFLKGIAIKGIAAPVLEENVISTKVDAEVTNEWAGIQYTGDSGGTASKNTISGYYSGITIAGNAAPTLEENTVDGNQFAINYLENASGVARGNILINNKAGIMVKDSATATLESNTITGDGGVAEVVWGILFTDQGAGIARNNQINGYYLGIDVDSPASISLEGNTISTCKHALRFQENAIASAIGNTISQNEVGIAVNNAATPTLEGNEIFSNTWAFVIDPATNPILINNNVHDNEYNE